MSAILQPPRAFQFVMQLSVPPDARSDQELTIFILTAISTSLALAAMQPRVGIARIAAVTLGTEVPQ